MTEEMLDALDRAGVRLTGPRRKLAALIERREGHFTAADLLKDAGRRRMGSDAQPSSDSWSSSASRGSLSGLTSRTERTPTFHASQHITTILSASTVAPQQMWTTAELKR